MLELAILGLLKEQPMHGYQLSRELGDSLGGFWRVSYGSLYPTLRRLERDGEVEAIASAETSAGRRKQVYRISAKGETVFLALLQETPHDNQSEDQRFRVRLAFFRYLPPETRLRLLERRRASLEERLGSITDSLRTTRARVDGYTRSLIEHGRSAAESDLAWVDGLIVAERTRKEEKAAAGGPGGRTAALRRKEHSS